MPWVRPRFSRLSISTRIALLFSATFFVGLVIAFGSVYFQLQYHLKKSDQAEISAKLKEFSEIYGQSGLIGVRDFFANENRRVANASFMIRILDSKGKPLFDKASVQDRKLDFDFQEDLNSSVKLGWYSISANNEEEEFDVLTEVLGNGQYLQVGRSNQDRNDVLEDIAADFIIATGVLFFLGGGLGFWYSRKSLNPIRNLLTTIQKIEKGDFTQRVTLGPVKDELFSLGETFNRMISRIDKLIQMMSQSIDNVAHDIRTPLTRIRSVAEFALLADQKGHSKEALLAALEDCAESATELSGMVDQLLSISEAEAGTMILHRENCDVMSLLRNVADVYEFVALEKEIEISIVSGEALFWNFDRRRMTQVVANLLDNAIKFSPPGTKVALSATGSLEGLCLSVEDSGPGISDSDQERIWDRLFRGDKGRSSKGAGLGLAIVKSTVLAHDGQVRALPKPSGGMIFSVFLPNLQIP